MNLTTKQSGIDRGKIPNWGKICDVLASPSPFFFSLGIRFKGDECSWTNPKRDPE